MPQIVKLKILTALFLFCIFNYLPAAETLHVPGERYSVEDTGRHYQQGKEFYSQGRYDEARNEFGKALDSISPPRTGVTAEAPEQQKALEIVPSERRTSKEKALEEEKTAEEKKKKEEEEKKEGEKKVEEVTKGAATEKAAPETKETGEREYYIDVSDVLDISVWQIPDLSKSEVIVRPDGKISFPLIGDIKAEGLTLTQLDNIITEKLKAYVKTPEVSIMIRRFGEQTNKIVVLGEIRSPGVYKFNVPPTITEVVASAGGYSDYAVLNSIMIIRGDIRTKLEAIRVNVAQVLKSGRLSQNIFLKPNDIVYVPRSFIGKINTFLTIIQPGISEYMQTMDARAFHNTMHRNQ